MRSDDHRLPGILLLGLLVLPAAGAERLVATEAVAGLTVPEGTKARVLATHEEHQVTSPTALAYDGQGRLHIAETHRLRHGIEDNRNHPYWILDDIASRTIDDRRAMLKKWDEKVSPEYLTAKTEILRVLTDPGDDGVFAKSTVLADDFNDALDGTAGGVFAYEDTLYFACIPTIHTLKIGDDGGSVGGVLLKTDEDFVELDVAGEKRRIPRGEIESMTDPISSMPPMGGLLTPEEIRDVIEWLQRRKR